MSTSELAREDGDLVPLVVVGGPTAAGKSQLALELARRHGGTIISADSRQVYRGFDIGTAKPTRAEPAEVPHEMIDIAEPTETYTVARYRSDARAAIARAHRAGRVPLVVGGTGFYIRAVLGYTPVPPVPPDPERRKRLEALPDLHERVRAVDPEAASRLHPHDRFRLARALEVFEASGRRLSDFKAEPAPYRTAYLVIALSRDLLKQRIDRRVDEMLDLGWMGEIERIVTEFGPDLGLLQTLGYAELMAVRSGNLTLDQARGLIAQNTWRYARRQLAWFRHEPSARWLEMDGDGTLEAWIELAERELSDWIATRGATRSSTPSP